MEKRTDWYYLIDGIRGIALVNMVLFHFCYDVFIVFGDDPHWYARPPVYAWQQFICITFIFISGISCHFSRNNWKRGLQLNLYGFCITAVTLIFMPSQTVWFGILNFIGCATLLISLLRRWLQRCNPALCLPLSLLCFLLLRSLPEGYVGIGPLKLLTMPEWLYEVRLFTFLGFPHSSFFSSDFFPILPWFFLFLAGYWFWDLSCRKDILLRIFRRRIPVLSLIGSKTIWIYLAHQPLLYLITYVMHSYLSSP